MKYYLHVKILSIYLVGMMLFVSIGFADQYSIGTNVDYFQNEAEYFTWKENIIRQNQNNPEIPPYASTNVGYVDVL